MAVVDQQRQRDLSNVPRLCLNSPGGDYREGLRVAGYLMEKSVGTAVAEGGECYSACAIIFMGGTFPWKGELNRYLHVRGILGFMHHTSRARQKRAKFSSRPSRPASLSAKASGPFRSSCASVSEMT
jgi:hypothetical protein